QLPTTNKLLRLLGHLAAAAAGSTSATSAAFATVGRAAALLAGHPALAAECAGVGRDGGLVLHPADGEAVAGPLAGDAQGDVVPLRIDRERELADDQPFLKGEVALQLPLLGAFHRVVDDVERTLLLLAESVGERAVVVPRAADDDRRAVPFQNVVNLLLRALG